jgi:hypothetical protein
MSNACPACGKKYTLPAGSVGRAFVCKRCGLKLQISEHGLTVPSIPDAGPPIPPPQPVHHGPPPAIDVEPVGPAGPPAYPPPAYQPYAPTPSYPVAAPPPRAAFDPDEDEDDESPFPRRRPSAAGNVLLDFLLLRRHIAPTLIVVFFWAGTAILVLSGLSTIAGSFDAPKGISLSGGGMDLGGLGQADPGLGGLGGCPGSSRSGGSHSRCSCSDWCSCSSARSCCG